MSETNETNRSKIHDHNWVERMAELDDGKCITAGGMLTRNQPAASGPGLTEAMVRAIESARNTFRQNEVEYRRLAEDRGQLDDRYHAYKDVERNCKEDADALDNLLARDAKADTVITKGAYVEPTMTPDIARDVLTDVPDTVTLRREVLASLLSLFRDTTYRLGKSDMGFGEDWEDRRELTVAEAEAALMKGGE